MGSLNKVSLIGYLGTDAKMNTTASGQAVANFTMATNEYWVNKEGTKEQRTEWHKVVLWGKHADTLGQYLKKGRQVYVEGRLQTNTWENDNKSYRTAEVVAQTVRFLDSHGKKEEQEAEAKAA